MARYRWTTESTVELNARSSVHPVHASVSDLEGEVNVDASGGSFSLSPAPSGYVEMQVDSLKSGKKLEDMALRKVLDAKKFPAIRYELRSADGGPDHFKIRGALTFHGTTREFDEEISAKLENGKLVVEGEHEFNIEDWGVKAPKILSLQVYPDVKIKARLVGKEG
ncbi:MAG TPA: YceI family protein [Acidimicrobiales bacterium]|nr:YceI family protein [Acidimicrobiales bacterium]